MCSWLLPRTALVLWLFHFLSRLAVAAQEPGSSVTFFSNQPSRLFFFEDSPTTIYHDLIDGNVYESQDEGATWTRADTIPEGEASMVIEHPFDNKYAFVLTRGYDHYRTADRGKTWQRFVMPVPPALVGKPLSFHSDPQKYGYILYQGTACESTGGWGSVCHDETYYTKDAFSDEAELLLSETSRCQFAHSSKDFKHDAHPDLIYCVGFDTSSSTGMHSLSSSRLLSSTDFFDQDLRVEDLGIGKQARGVVAFAIVSKFAVVALRDLSPGSDGEMLLYVSVDTKTWAKARFPHASSARLRENGYTIVESTTHSLAVDVMLQDMTTTIGTLFVSNSNGTFFVESLKDTNRNEMGYVDYENLYGIEGVGLANIVANAEEVEGRRAQKQLRTRITFDDGRSWARLHPPRSGVSCDVDDDACSLHLHSVTIPHNFGRVFSSPAPGFVMGVGSVGAHLRPYDECDTFLSTDAGLTWKMVREGAHKYEFGDSGSIMVLVNDEESTDQVTYSTDLGQTWQTYSYGFNMRARILTTVSDSTSQKFMLVGQVSREDVPGRGRWALVYLDFAPVRSRKCGDNDFERWYARSRTHECLMGHRQWYRRRKPDVDCYIGEKFHEPIEHEENCACRDEDYECDYNFVRQGNECVPVGPEPIPAGVCPPDQPDKTYLGSSGYRLIPGNTCDKEAGVKKDDRVEKSCANAQPAEGEIVHQIFEFQAPVVQFAYFKESTTILVRLEDFTIWQSSNEGYTWHQIQPGERFVAFYHHTYSHDRAYLITAKNYFYYTTDTGRTWLHMPAPLPPNNLGLQILHFHPTNSDNLIWSGSSDCGGFGENCHVEAFYTRDNGRHWTSIEKYVRNCAWARDAELLVDPNQIICEVYQNQRGNQRFFGLENPLQLISGADFFRKKTKLFDHVVGFTKFNEFLIVAEYQAQQQSLDLQVSLDGRSFASGAFPPNLRPDQHAYTILESSTMSVFLHVTTSERPRPYWGSILKSNSNGTYYSISLENVNRNDAGYVDFEKMIGLDGIALVNVVSNPQEATLTGRKELETRITHNDGGTWKRLVPPVKDSLGNYYDCDSTRCALHIHGYTERYDARATYSTPSVPGLLMAVGNVGEALEDYTESDTFLSRDAGFTWEEVHKDAHTWEFGDSGSILIMANDEEPTDHVLFSTDEGLNWREYKFTDERIRVKEIVTVPSDTSRRFILMGYYPRSPATHVAAHIDFSALTWKECVFSEDNPGSDDFELWSPSEERNELCLFGRQTMYHRRVREANCIVGKRPKVEAKFVKNCACSDSDFECEFNYYRAGNGSCVLVPGTQPRPDDDSCHNDEDYWYARTAYRKIPYSSCEGGQRIDHGAAHLCPGIRAHGTFFWLMMFFIPCAFAALAGWWYVRKRSRGAIRLPGGDAGPRYRGDSGMLETIASVPYYALAVAGAVWEAVVGRFADATTNMRTRGGYRTVPIDEDAQILRFEDEE
ncbi:hypothetical protein FOMPIDRAFT_101305 [Fomitopsis schrenkii]|uniref:Vacuolar protein sorting/targeting protein 10 n=1 Tax=Fomitopsis schrenkii TaxID=2126942 RepID=S8F7V6_FOMSC|nr:hypothetical protein FOMPIDRAFT_101305 [Fomitopsis schrenkii]